MAIPTFEDRGHDPYNYVGRQVQRRESWLLLKERMLNGFLVLPPRLYCGIDFGSKPSETFYWKPLMKEGAVVVPQA